MFVISVTEQNKYSCLKEQRTLAVCIELAKGSGLGKVVIEASIKASASAIEDAINRVRESGIEEVYLATG